MYAQQITNPSINMGRRMARINIKTNATMALACVLILVLQYCLLVTATASNQLQASQHRRVKRALYELPADAELLLSSQLRTTFTCDGLGYGYYADLDNECKIFHICQSFKMSDGSIYNNHWSFVCANQTIFNQVSLTCTHPEDAIPCENAKEFYHVNDYFGDIRAPSVRDSDLSSAADLVSRSYGSRLSSTSSAPVVLVGGGSGGNDDQTTR